MAGNAQDRLARFSQGCFAIKTCEGPIRARLWVDAIRADGSGGVHTLRTAPVASRIVALLAGAATEAILTISGYSS